MAKDITNSKLIKHFLQQNCNKGNNIENSFSFDGPILKCDDKVVARLCKKSHSMKIYKTYDSKYVPRIRTLVRIAKQMKIIVNGHLPLMTSQTSYKKKRTICECSNPIIKGHACNRCKKLEHISYNIGLKKPNSNVLVTTYHVSLKGDYNKY